MGSVGFVLFVACWLLHTVGDNEPWYLRCRVRKLTIEEFNGAAMCVAIMLLAVSIAMKLWVLMP